MKTVWFGLALARLLAFTLFSCSKAQSGENDECLICQQECGNRTLADTLSNIPSDSCIELLAGIHQLSDFEVVSNVSNVTIYGAEGPEDTIITCSQGVGLAFIECSNVTLKNITINNCSLTGDNLNTALDFLSQSTYVLFTVPPELSISLFLGSSEDIELQNVVVKDTTGLGLLAVNVLGQFVINESSFLGNVPDGCFFINTTSMDAGIGGGAVIIYHETLEPSQLADVSTLSVTNTVFTNNSNCGISSSMLLYSMSQVSFLQDRNESYMLGGGGGLTLLMCMYRYPVNVYIDQVTFQNNTAQFGGGLFVGLFTAVSNTSITVHNSTFVNNGLSTDVDLTNPSFSIFGAVTVVKDIVYLKNTPYLGSIVKTGPNQLIFVKTRFLENVAYCAGTLLVYSLYTEVPNGDNDRIVIQSCVFDGNQAYLGAVARLLEYKSKALQEGLEIEVQDTNFTSNQLLTFTTGSPTIDNLSSTSRSSGIVELFSMKFTLKGNILFLNNSGTAIHGEVSIVEINGETIFKENSGSYGGSLGLIGQSFLLVKNNSYVKIVNNSAYISGGGIYTDHQGASLHYYDCFLYFDVIDAYCQLYDDCPNLGTLNITISFGGNVSPLGSAVYGSTLQTCSWLNINSNSNAFLYLQDVGIFEFNSTINNNSFNTPPSQMDILRPYDGSIMPGQTASFSLVAYDRFNHPVFDPITSTIIDDGGVHGAYQAVLGASGYWFVNEEPNGSSVPIFFQSLRDVPQEGINVTVGIYSDGSSAAQVVSFTLHQCYPGFAFPTTSSGSYNTCVCDQLLVGNSNVECNSTSADITVYNSKWAGMVNDTDGNISVLTVTDCPLDYCKPGAKPVTKGIFDSQCSTDFNRKGVACGQCVENYSVVIGSNRCLKCSDFYLFYVGGFAICGVAILFVLIRSNFTVSTGYFSCLVFYANVMALYQPYFLPYVHYYGILSPIIFWNLGIGYETCLYNGMTPLWKGYLRFVFPIYLWTLMTVLVLAGRWNVRRNAHNTPSAIASLLLLCYVSTLESCIAALSSLKVGENYMWRVDPSVSYFSLGHVILVVFSAVVIVTYIIPFPILISVPALTLRTSFGKRLIPICDAFWAAYNPKFHFWEGLRTLVRIAVFLSNFLAPTPLNVFILGVACVGMIVLTALFSPYRNRNANIFEIFLLGDIVLIAQGVLYFAGDPNDSDYLSSGNADSLVIYTCVCLLPVYGILILLTITSFLRQRPEVQRNMMNMLDKVLRRIPYDFVKPSSEEESDKENIEPSTRKISVVTYAELREALLDDPETCDKPLLIASHK